MKIFWQFKVRTKLIVSLVLTGAILLLPSCATHPPKNTNDVCDIFSKKHSWYRSAKRSEERWGVPVYVTMAFVHQESRFIDDAKPPRRKIFGFIPGPRPSNAYGYAQALKTTWRQYQKETGNNWGSRSNFDDAVDFIGWFNHKSFTRNKIQKDNAYALYLAYHEGHGGYSRGSYKNKPWLIKVSRKVHAQARRYQSQFQSCQAELNKNWLQRLFS